MTSATCRSRKIREDDWLIIDAVEAAIAAGEMPFCLGGDHAITFPAAAAVAKAHGPLNILHFDAHSDIYESFQGNPRSHASPFARIMRAFRPNAASFRSASYVLGGTYGWIVALIHPNASFSSPTQRKNPSISRASRQKLISSGLMVVAPAFFQFLAAVTLAA